MELLDLEGGGEKILKANKSMVQRAAIAAILYGQGAAHLGNWLFTVNDERVDQVYLIDQEESMMPINRLSKEWHLSGFKEEDQDKAKENLTTGRNWLLGWPQNKQPIDQELLEELSDYSIKEKLERYHQEYETKNLFGRVTIDAQFERLEVIQSLAKKALQTNKPLTPREIYYQIYGGEHLYHHGKSLGYPDSIIFNHIISDPYQHVIKNYLDLSESKPASFDKSNSIYINNLEIIN
ncbi:hypothetical protein N9Y92_00200 [Chlamydiales bacterium]|nr:hypothetical protein [Chlamydiales bacterium]